MSGLTPQYILRKSLCREAYCFSAHIPGQGYINDGKDPVTRADYDAQRMRSAESEIDNLEFAPAYAEPGYADPVSGILFANWNIFPRGIDNVLERAGYAIEWSDEWSTCYECGKAVRTQPDSYGWTASFYIFNECELVCRECILEDPTDYLEDITDNPRKALSPAFGIDPIDHGYQLIETDFENGFHHGQTDDPRAIYKRLVADGHTSILFTVDSVGQFDVCFSVYAKD